MIIPPLRSIRHGWREVIAIAPARVIENSLRCGGRIGPVSFDFAQDEVSVPLRSRLYLPLSSP
jgi:hypothetical protein